MIDDVSDIAAYYNSDPAREDRRLEHQQLEYDLTWRYLDQYLPAQACVLEVGAATGRYTLELARRGYKVTAVDLSPSQIETCRTRLEAEGLEKQVRLAVADARDLSPVPEKGFDAILLMGPLYHLVQEADRKTALTQAVDHLREGGILFSAFISRYGILGHLIKNTPDWIEDQAEVHSLLERGRGRDDAPRGGFRGYYVRVGEVVPLHEAIGLETIVLAGIEPGISADDESYNLLTGKQRQMWLDLFYEVSTERSIVAASRHLLYIGRKI